MDNRLQEIRDRLKLVLKHIAYDEAVVIGSIFSEVMDALEQEQSENKRLKQGLNYECSMVDELLQAVQWQEAQISVMSAVMSGKQGATTNLKIVKNNKGKELAVIAHQLQQSAERERVLRTGLEIIAHPLKYLQEQAELQGANLNGEYAIELMNDAGWLKSKAVETLGEATNERD